MASPTSSTGSSGDPEHLDAFVDDLLEKMVRYIILPPASVTHSASCQQTEVKSASDDILKRLDGMGSSMADLERSIQTLMASDHSETDSAVATVVHQSVVRPRNFHYYTPHEPQTPSSVEI